MSDFHSDIKLYSDQLDRGQTIRVDCPMCQGTDKTLSITLNEEGTLLWNCFRASCDIGDGSGVAISGAANRKVHVPDRRRVFDGITVPLRDEDAVKVEELWGIRDPEHWYFTPDAGGRVAMSIRSPKFLHRGWVLRDLWGRQQRKALTYVNDGEIGISWYKTQPGKPTVIVEDIPSAVRASKYVNAVALCGTGCGVARAMEINEYATRPIHVALDLDAVQTGVRIARRWALLWGDVRVTVTEKDMKDMDEGRLCQLLEGLK
jgi:hypothetical protein